jgi:Ca2+-binding RTX toxin-like protein
LRRPWGLLQHGRPHDISTERSIPQSSLGGGDDTITGDVGLNGVGAIDVNGGAGVDTANYRGTAAGDTISTFGAGGEARTVGAGPTTFDTTEVEHLNVQGLGGDDTLAGVGLVPTPLTLDGGAGADTLRGSAAPEILLGGSGNDHADGNLGADVAEPGTGNDRFQWDPGDSSDTVEGQGGSDVIDFNASNAGEFVDVSANSPRVQVTRNIGSVTMDADDVEGFALRALGGADTITVNDLSGTDLQTADVDLSATAGGGDAQADTVIANGSAGADAARVSRTGGQARVKGLGAETRVVGSEVALDSLRVQTLAGDDEVTIASNLSDLIALVVDLGADD